MEAIEQIKTRILNHQKENGFRAIFDFILEDLDAVEAENKVLGRE